MPFQSTTPKEQNNLPVYEMVTVCGITLPKLKDIMEFPPVLRAEVADLLLGYVAILNSAFSKETFKNTAKDSLIYTLKMFAAWSQHPVVAKEDRYTFERLWTLLHPPEDKPDAPRMSEEDLKLITDCVRDLVAPLISTGESDNPKAKRKPKSKNPSALTN